MAGSEKTGVAVARADLFEGATCVITPTPSTDPSAVARVEQFWHTLGMRLVRHDPHTHDHLVALVSHLPHAVAAAVVGVQSDASIDLRGKGFLDTTRVAAGDAGLWRDILMDNRQNVVEAIDQLNAELTHLATHLRAADAVAVEAWLAKQSARRAPL
jgi:prephenate dehydrogenase